MPRGRAHRDRTRRDREYTLACHRAITKYAGRVSATEPLRVPLEDYGWLYTALVDRRIEALIEPA